MAVSLVSVIAPMLHAPSFTYRRCHRILSIDRTVKFSTTDSDVANNLYHIFQ